MKLVLAERTYPGQTTRIGSAFAYLRAGESATVDIGYTVETAAGRSASSTITVTITGVDNAAEISGSDRGQVYEGGAERAEGVLHAEDADHGQSSFRAVSVQGEFGTLRITIDGAWSYELDEEAEALAALRRRPSAHPASSIGAGRRGCAAILRAIPHQPRRAIATPKSAYPLGVSASPPARIPPRPPLPYPWPRRTTGEGR